MMRLDESSAEVPVREQEAEAANLAFEVRVLLTPLTLEARDERGIAFSLEVRAELFLSAFDGGQFSVFVRITELETPFGIRRSDLLFAGLKVPKQLVEDCE